MMVGNEGGTNVGASLQRAADALGHAVEYKPIAEAFASWRPVRLVSWHLLGRRPPRLGSFSASVVKRVEAWRPHLLLATGTAPLTAAALQQIQAVGTVTVNYLTDDPWNPTFRGSWLLDSIARYDVVFSPRRSNLGDLRQLGGGAVSYLPFGYDADLFFPIPDEPKRYDIIFAAAADTDRVPFIEALLQRGYEVGLFGVYWNRFPNTRGRAGEWLSPSRLRASVGASRTALWLVRRANRDGHVMRTYELAAMRACILAEDTVEQREILGDGAVYFQTIPEMIGRLDALLANEAERERLARAAYERITLGANTYRDRLVSMLDHVERLFPSTNRAGSSTYNIDESRHRHS
ncbi:MAG: glycosyltransferase [Gemmatimonadota bacterium]